MGTTRVESLSKGFYRMPQQHRVGWICLELKLQGHLNKSDKFEEVSQIPTNQVKSEQTGQIQTNQAISIDSDDLEKSIQTSKFDPTY